MARTIREQVRQRIHRDRDQLGDVAVTAVLFGFTLNLLSDFVTSIPESISLSFAKIVIFAATLYTIKEYLL